MNKLFRKKSIAQIQADAAAGMSDHAAGWNWRRRRRFAAFARHFRFDDARYCGNRRCGHFRARR